MTKKATKKSSPPVLPPPLDLLVRSDIILSCSQRSEGFPASDGLLYRYHDEHDGPDFYEVGPRKDLPDGKELDFVCTQGHAYNPFFDHRGNERLPADILLDGLAWNRRPDGEGGFSHGVFFYLHFKPRAGSVVGDRYRTLTVLLNTSRETLLCDEKDYQFISYPDFLRGAQRLLKGMYDDKNR